MPDYYYGFLGILLLLIVLAALVAKRRMSKIDHLPPEHRAKENELYEALGLEEPSEEAPPKDHENKEKEVETAFGHEAMQQELEETFASGKPMKKADKKKKKGKKGKKKNRRH